DAPPGSAREVPVDAHDISSTSTSVRTAMSRCGPRQASLQSRTNPSCRVPDDGTATGDPERYQVVAGAAQCQSVISQVVRTTPPQVHGTGRPSREETTCISRRTSEDFSLAPRYGSQSGEHDRAYSVAPRPL